MNFRDMTTDEKSYYRQIKVRDDDLDVLLGILGTIAGAITIWCLIEMFK